MHNTSIAMGLHCFQRQVHPESCPHVESSAQGCAHLNCSAGVDSTCMAQCGFSWVRFAAVKPPRVAAPAAVADE